MLKTIPIKDLVPFDKNPRINDKAVDRVLESLKANGYVAPIVVNEIGNPFEQHVIAAGHTRWKALKKFGAEEVQVFVYRFDSESHFVRYNIEDNKTAEFAEWDEGLLAELAGSYELDLGEIGFDDWGEEEKEGNTDPDDVPEPPAEPVAKLGQMWQLGNHRLLCGDSTDRAQVERLMGGEKAQLIHADPPYGMDFDDDGVLNDDLKGSELAAFQMSWYKAYRPFMANSASVYVWGWEDSLFEFYLGLREDAINRIKKRNYLIWNKGSGQGIRQESLRRFAPVTEHCLFFMLGEQGFNNNADNYWEGWEPIRAYLDGERKKAGLSTSQCNKICGKQNMTQAAFTKGSFRLILREDYEKLKLASNGDAFKREYDDLKREYDDLKREFYSTRAYFDNTHDNMTDVWNFKRVIGEERHGHATPKPVEMMERIMKSSLPAGGLCVEPFGGSGSTLMAAEKTGRRCYTVELQPIYCDVIIKRWEQFTGQTAELIND